jgi:hypothetical protein
MDLKRDNMGSYGLYLSGLGEGSSGIIEHGNEPFGSIKCWEILEWLVPPRGGLSSMELLLLLLLLLYQ